MFCFYFSFDFLTSIHNGSHVTHMHLGFFRTKLFFKKHLEWSYFYISFLSLSLSLTWLVTDTSKFQITWRASISFDKIMLESSRFECSRVSLEPENLYITNSSKCCIKVYLHLIELKCMMLLFPTNPSCKYYTGFGRNNNVIIFHSTLLQILFSKSSTVKSQQTILDWWVILHQLMQEWNLQWILRKCSHTASNALFFFLYTEKMVVVLLPPEARWKTAPLLFLS